MIFDINGNVIANPERKIDDHTSPTLVEGFYIGYSNGWEYEYASLNYAEYDVIPGEKIVYKYTVQNAGTIGLAFFNEAGTYISGVYASSAEQTITVPDNAVLMKATVESVDQVAQLSAQTLIDVGLRLATAEKVTSAILDVNPLDNISFDTGYVGSFSGITFFGDELTAGDLAYNRHNGSQSSGTYASDYTPAYPYMFPIMNCYKCGISGATAYDFIDRVENGDYGWLDNNSSIIHSEAFVIALGTNDIEEYGSFTGYPATDIDIHDPTQNADTSVGNYARLISRILANQPKARIFLCCIPNTRNTEETRTAANFKIKGIAAMFPDNCFAMDFQTYGVNVEEVDAWKAKYYNGSLPNSLGYNMIARMVMSYMNWIIENNPDKFRTLGFIGTTYDWATNNNDVI